MRAFIFSLDAFVAFTLALIAIYSLIFFSSIPSSYYYLLTQGHFLSRDTLLTMSTTFCNLDYGCENYAGSHLIDYLVTNSRDQKSFVQKTIGTMIPNHFGYSVEYADGSNLNRWISIYDTSTEQSDTHAKTSKRISVSSQIPVFRYSAPLKKTSISPFRYLTCNGDSTITADGVLITCGEDLNKPKNQVLGQDVVPSTDVKVVRLTVFI